MDPSNSCAAPLSVQACRCPHLDALLPQEIEPHLIFDHSSRKKRKGSEIIQQLHFLPFLDPSDSPLDNDSSTTAEGVSRKEGNTSISDTSIVDAISKVDTISNHPYLSLSTGGLQNIKRKKKRREDAQDSGVSSTIEENKNREKKETLEPPMSMNEGENAGISLSSNEQKAETKSYHLSAERYNQLRQAENTFETNSSTLYDKSDKKSMVNQVKSSSNYSTINKHDSLKDHSKGQKHIYNNVLDAIHISSSVNQLIEVVRKVRRDYWELQILQKQGKTDVSHRRINKFGDSRVIARHPSPSCSMCSFEPKLRHSVENFSNDKETKENFDCDNDNDDDEYSFHPSGDELIQCLECSMVACGPYATSPCTKQHMMCHFLTTGHNFGISCGQRSEIFCMRCGDFVYHPVLDREKHRIDLSFHLPRLSWKDGILKRSIALGPIINPQVGEIMWPKVKATYPCDASSTLIKAGQISLQRYYIFNGILEDSLGWGRKATRLALHQKLFREKFSSSIIAPIGIHNLGNTCYMNCILQCLLHCAPLQQFFLNNVGHNYAACQYMRKCYIEDNDLPKDSPYAHCMACEMDRIFLETFGNSIGIDAIEALEELSLHSSSHSLPFGEISTDGEDDQKSLQQGNNNLSKSGNSGDQNFSAITYDNMKSASEISKGCPIVPVPFLSAAWKSPGMTHLAGYEQRDAHEFLHAFLDTMGKHTRMYNELTEKTGACNGKNNSSFDSHRISDKTIKDPDIVKELFEGTLRSVLVCERCGCKRTQPEPFVIISLPIIKGKSKPASNLFNTHQSSINSGSGGSSVVSRRGMANLSKTTIQQCLVQFTEPEILADVHCASCGEKTRTQKQHTFAKLPEVLCLHLKRFDANTNKKISDPVAFPLKGLNMGSFLPHWCEVGQGTQGSSTESTASSPQILYDLIGTVNHCGNLHQGHYVSNVKVSNRWYGCNDAFVNEAATEDGNGEKEVASEEDSAYILFYKRR